jgi:predicted permease
MTNILRGLRSGLFLFRAEPGIALTAVAALAAGIGFSTTMFSIVHGATRSLPFADAGRIVAVQVAGPPARPADVEAWSGAGAFERLGAYSTLAVNLAGDGQTPERAQGAAVTPNTFVMLGTPALTGRVLGDPDAAPGAEPVVLLSYELWQRRFRGDAGIVGAAIRVNGAPRTVTGVMPPRFGFPIRADLWTPLALDPAAEPGEGDAVQAFGRLARGVPATAATAEVEAITRRLAAQAPDAYRDTRLAVVAFTEIETPREAVRGLYLLLFAVSGVLFIACANVANLFIARAATRARDVAVRLALGAGRRAIVVEQVAETLVLSVLAAALGLGMAAAGTRLFRDNTAHIIEAFWVDFRVDAYVAAFAIVLAVLAAAAAALVPALRASGADVADSLRDGGGASGLRIGRLGRALVPGQLTMASGVLALTLLLGQTAVSLYAREWPFDAAALLATDVGVPVDTLDDAAARVRLLTALDEALARVPGATATAMASALPGRGSGNWSFALDTPAEPGRRLPTTSLTMVSPGYFDVLDARPRVGRLLGPGDTAAAPAVAVVNDSFVARHSPDRDPIGRRIFIGTRELTVVGVIPDRMPSDIQDLTQDGIYASIFQLRPFAVRLMARGPADPLLLAPAVRAAVESVDRDLPMYETFTVRDAALRDKLVLSVLTRLFAIFGAGALLLTAIGLYSVTAFAVAQRTREFGIRLALGATAGDLLRLVAAQGARQVALGLGAGLVLAVLLVRGFTVAVEAVAQPMPLILGGVLASLGVTAMLALVWPVRQAGRTDVMRALRRP